MADQRLWQCELYGYDTGGDVKSAAAFEDIPADRSRPVSGAEKDDLLLEDEVEV